MSYHHSLITKLHTLNDDILNPLLPSYSYYQSKIEYSCFKSTCTKKVNMVNFWIFNVTFPPNCQFLVHVQQVYSIDIQWKRIDVSISCTPFQKCKIPVHTNKWTFGLRSHIILLDTNTTMLVNLICTFG